MPKKLNEWLEENKGHDLTGFGLDSFEQMQNMAEALINLHDNAVEVLGDENEATLALSEVTKNILSLAEQSLNLTEKDTKSAKNSGNIIIEDDDNIIDNDNNINNINNDNNKKDDKVEAARKWEQAVAALNTLNVLLNRDFKAYMDMGAADPKANKKVNMNAVFDGLDLLGKSYGIDAKQESLKKNYVDRQKITSAVPYTIFPEYEEKYSKPAETGEDYTAAVNSINGAISDIHSNRYGLIEGSSDEHDEMADAAERLKKAFADPDLWADPAEKLAALEEAKSKALAYRRKKRENQNIQYDAETSHLLDEGNLSQAELENLDAFEPGSTAGKDRYRGAKKLIDAVNTITRRYKTELKEASVALTTAKKFDPALVNNDKLLISLDELDDDLNAKHRTGLFSGSSSAHDKLKKSVEALRKALDPKSLPSARKDKLAALKTAKEMASKYIEKNEGAGSNMGERRLDAAQKIFDLADKEIAVMEAAMTRKNDLSFNFKAWNDEVAKADNAHDPISKSKKAALDKLSYNAYALEKVYGYMPEAVNSGEVKKISKEMAADDKLINFYYLLIEANTDDRSVFYKNRDKLKKLSQVMTNEDYEKILWTCDRLKKHRENNEEEEIINYPKAFIESIETANLLFGAEFDLKTAHAIYRAQEEKNLAARRATERKKAEEMQARQNEKLEKIKAQNERLKQWEERFPCKPDKLKSLGITDPEIIKNVNELDSFAQALEGLNEINMRIAIKAVYDSDVADKLINTLSGLKAGAYTAEQIKKSPEAKEQWGNFMIAAKDFSEFLKNSRNYDRLISIAAAGTQVDAEEYEDFTDFRKCLCDVIKGLNKFHGLEIEERKVDLSPIGDKDAKDNNKPAPEGDIENKEEDKNINNIVIDKDEKNLIVIDDDEPEEEDDLERALKYAQSNLEKAKSGAKVADNFVETSLKTVIAVHLIKKQKWENVKLGEIINVRNTMDELPEYESMKKNIPEDKLTEFALDGDGGRLYDSFMTQRTNLRKQGKNITKDNYHKEMREKINMETFI